MYRVISYVPAVLLVLSVARAPAGADEADACPGAGGDTIAACTRVLDQALKIYPSLADARQNRERAQAALASQH
jgi:hypothetical protein